MKAYKDGECDEEKNNGLFEGVEGKPTQKALNPTGSKAGW